MYSALVLRLLVLPSTTQQRKNVYWHASTGCRMHIECCLHTECRLRCVARFGSAWSERLNAQSEQLDALGAASTAAAGAHWPARRRWPAPWPEDAPAGCTATASSAAWPPRVRSHRVCAQARRRYSILLVLCVILRDDIVVFFYRDRPAYLKLFSVEMPTICLSYLIYHARLLSLIDLMCVLFLLIFL